MWLDSSLQIIAYIEWASLGYFLVVNSFYAILLVSAALELRHHVLSSRDEVLWKISGSNLAPSVSVLAPAYNEETTITDSVKALLAIYYPNLEVIVVNDGSRDSTMEVLREQFELEPINTLFDPQVPTRPVTEIYRSRTHSELTVVNKENGGKADALNAAVNIATGELVCSIDADTIIEPDAIQRMVKPFMQREDVVAAGGVIRPVNSAVIHAGQIDMPRGPRKPIVGFQVMEYLRAFLFGRLGWNRLGGNLIISGAFGLFRKDALVRAGGYFHDTVGEDMELVVRLRRLGYKFGGPSRVEFIPDPVAWTEVPETLRVLARQRDRWHRGLADVMWRHRGVLFNPRYRAMGMVVYPYFLFVELLAPVVEFVGLVGLAVSLWAGSLDMAFAALYLLVAYGYGLVLGTLTLLLDEIAYHRYRQVKDRLWLLLWTCLESLGYRQLTVIWRLRGLVRYVRGKRDWGAMDRRGLDATTGQS